MNIRRCVCVRVYTCVRLCDGVYKRKQSVCSFDGPLSNVTWSNVHRTFLRNLQVMLSRRKKIINHY